MKYFFSDSHLKITDYLKAQWLGSRWLPEEQSSFNGDDKSLESFLAYTSHFSAVDHIYCLGDFIDIPHEEFTSKVFREELATFLSGLKGTWHLIPGNHDSKLISIIKEVTLKNFVIEDSIFEVEVGNNISLVCSHFPLEEWNNKHKGFFHLHGHLHGNLPTRLGGRKDISSNIKFFDRVQFYTEDEIVASIVKEISEKTILINEECLCNLYINSFISWDPSSEKYSLHRYSKGGSIDFFCEYGVQRANLIFIDYFGNWFRLNIKVVSS